MVWKAEFTYKNKIPFSRYLDFFSFFSQYFIKKFDRKWFKKINRNVAKNAFIYNYFDFYVDGK